MVCSGTLLEFLERSNASLSKYDYVLYVDALDMALVGDASDLVSSFIKYDADVVACATEKNTPDSFKKEGSEFFKFFHFCYGPYVSLRDLTM